MPNPAIISTLSLTISSCARRLVFSGFAPSSFRMTSIFLPATLSPCCWMYSLTALSSCLPVEACPPVIGMISPILTVPSAAKAGSTADSAVAAASAATAMARSRLWFFTDMKRFSLLAGDFHDVDLDRRKIRRKILDVGVRQRWSYHRHRVVFPRAGFVCLQLGDDIRLGLTGNIRRVGGL